MRLFACILTILAAVVSYPTLADGTLRSDKDCTPEAETCTVHAGDLFALLKNNDKGWEIAYALKDRVQELQAQLDAKEPKCGTLEVVPKKPKVDLKKIDPKTLHKSAWRWM